MKTYLGSELIHDAGTFEFFDRKTALTKYELRSALNTGTFGADITPRGLLLSGYTPTLLADLGQDGLFSMFTDDAQTQVFPRWQDNDNWVAFSRSSPTECRLRIRTSGVNSDTALSISSSTGSLQMVCDGTDVAFYIAGEFIYAWNGSHFLASTRKGFGSPSGSAVAYVRGIKFEPLKPWQRKSIPSGTNHEVNTAADAATSYHQISVSIVGSATDNFSAPTPDGDPAALECVQIICDALGKYPKYFVGATTNPRLAIRVGSNLNGGGASGSYGSRVMRVAKTPTASQFASVTTDVAVAREHVVHHEIMHALEDAASLSAASSLRATLMAAFNASNPPGFTYGGSPSVDGRPLGFCRGYGRTSFAEDVADVFAWLMTDGLRPELAARAASDVYLAGKVAAVRAFLRGFGWPSRYIPSL